MNPITSSDQSKKTFPPFEIKGASFDKNLDNSISAIFNRCVTCLGSTLSWLVSPLLWTCQCIEKMGSNVFNSVKAFFGLSEPVVETPLDVPLVGLANCSNTCFIAAATQGILGIDPTLFDALSFLEKNVKTIPLDAIEANVSILPPVYEYDLQSLGRIFASLKDVISRFREASQAQNSRSCDQLMDSFRRVLSALLERNGVLEDMGNGAQHDASELVGALLDSLLDQLKVLETIHPDENVKREATQLIKKMQIELQVYDVLGESEGLRPGDHVIANRMGNGTFLVKRNKSTSIAKIDLAFSSNKKEYSFNECLDHFFCENQAAHSSCKCEGADGNDIVLPWSERRVVFSKAPRNLFISFKRNEANSRKIEAPIQDIPHVLSLSYYIKKSPAANYQLVSAIIHEGSDQSGHYYTVRKIGDRYFVLNDEIVRECSKQEFDFKCTHAYTLFYEKL